jgi:ubiquitin-activating enzyme E1
VFLDYGENFHIFDKDGEETRNYIVTNITKSNPAIVTVHEDKRLKLSDDESVIFREIEGMTELNGRDAIGIETIDGFSFKLKIDSTNFADYKREGIVDSVKTPI